MNANLQWIERIYLRYVNVKRKSASADDVPEDCYWAATAKEQDGFLLVFMGQVEEGN
jgi:hypothetical protein